MTGAEIAAMRSRWMRFHAGSRIDGMMSGWRTGSSADGLTGASEVTSGADLSTTTAAKYAPSSTIPPAMTAYGMLPVRANVATNAAVIINRVSDLGIRSEEHRSESSH